MFLIYTVNKNKYAKKKSANKQCGTENEIKNICIMIKTF